MESKEKNLKALELLNKLPEESLSVIEDWLDPDFTILKDYLEFIPKTVCSLMILSEQNGDEMPNFKEAALKLSHLFNELKSFDVSNNRSGIKINPDTAS